MADSPNDRRAADRAPVASKRPADPGRRAAPAARARLGSGLVAAGALLLLIVAAVIFDAAVTAARVSARLEQLRSGQGAGAGAARREAGSSGIVGRIASARIGLDAAVLEGMGTVELMRGVGHDPASALPGEPGNVVLAGHRDTHFRALREVDAGDLIDLTTPDGSFTYRVDSILIVSPDRGDLLAATDEERLTLVTCYPFHWIGPAPQRLVVRAHPLGEDPVALHGPH